VKDYLETFLSSSGDVKTSLDVMAETQEIDVYFRPTSPEMPPELGLLGRLAQTPCLLEPHRNPVTIEGILACLSKLWFFRTYTVENSSSSLSAQQCSKVDKYQFNKNSKPLVYKLYKHELLIVLHDRFGRA
jgi:hypothetical protein